MRWLLIACLMISSPAWGTHYFLAPGGSDSNNGLSSGAPWLTPNHALNCGDVITATAGTYAASSFNADFGTVTCSAGNSVAWLACAIFDGCKINAVADTSALAVISVNKSYWGITGWEVTDSSDVFTGCFGAFPDPSTTIQIHHIIFANNVANGCQGGGFGSANEGHLVGVDYFAIVGNIAYNAATGSGECFSGISIYQPVASDALPGTHLYVAGNFTWDNVDPNPCAGSTPTDGEGITIDTLNGLQTASLAVYAQQVVVENNIAVFNGSSGVDVAGSGNSLAHVYFRHNTSYGNYTDTNQNDSACGQIMVSGFPSGGTNAVSLVETSRNLAVPIGATEPGCGSNPAYAFYVYNGNSTDHVYNEFGYSAAGNNVGIASSSGFSAGPNNTFANPGFVNPTNPGAPSCGSATSVANCMATVIANFTPIAAPGYGYQVPSTVSRYDPLFPQWLCNVNLPAGLVTPGCLTASAAFGSSLSGGTLQ